MPDSADNRRALPEIVTHDGKPVSAGGGYGLRARTPSNGYARARRFLDTCVQPDSTFFDDFRFSVALDGPPKLVTRWMDLGNTLFGDPTGSKIATWAVTEAALPTLLENFDDERGEFTHSDGIPLVSMYLDYKGLLLCPSTGRPYVGVSPADTNGFTADGYGTLLGSTQGRVVIRTNSTALSIFLSFPADDRLQDAAQYVQDNAPMRLSPKHWQRWRPDKTGTRYIRKPIPSPLA